MITVEGRTQDIIKAIRKEAYRPKSYRQSRFGMMAWASGYSEGKSVVMVDILDEVERLFEEGVLEA